MVPSGRRSMVTSNAPDRTARRRTGATGRQPGYAPSVRIVTIVGTRPQLIKAAALSPVLRARHEEILVDTGQHYDEAMAGVFFRELGLPRPDHSIGAGGGSHAEGTGRDADRAGADRRRRAARTPSSSTATRTRRWPGRWSRPS